MEPRNLTRAQIVANARVLRAEIEQIFIDLSHWNDSVRKPGEEPVDPDPDGKLRRIADVIDRMLANEDRLETEGRV